MHEEHPLPGLKGHVQLELDKGSFQHPCGEEEDGRFGRCVPRAVLLLVFCGLQPLCLHPNSVRSLRRVNKSKIEKARPAPSACAASCCASIRHDNRSSALSWIAILLLIRFAIFQAALGLQFSELGAVKRVVE